MVRIAAFNGTAYVDPKGKLPGRGAWFHPDPRCISRGRQRKALARRLRFDGEIPESLWHTLEQIAATATHGAS
ncbi:YlxR family protein [Schaalia suimastitidis]|uniref:YlxR family protein n=1 Tax=Schaalia suimastitidis TaxID=121163 RepID=UPI001040627A|nr:YlxR family protein [Schaalia suimastitidis]